MIIFYANSVSRTENILEKKSISGTRKSSYENSCTKFTCILFRFVQLFCFLPNFWITSLALNTVSHFVSVFEYGCENEGLNHIRVLIHLLRKSFDSETIDDEKSRAKQGFYYPNKKVETYEVLTERDIEIFLVRVCERVWATELNIKKGTCRNVRSGD